MVYWTQLLVTRVTIFAKATSVNRAIYKLQSLVTRPDEVWEKKGLKLI